MCGLAGFARHPSGRNLDTVTKIWATVFGRHRHRGRHATGMAAVRGTQPPYVWKHALPIDVVMQSSAWEMDVLDQIRADTTIVLGHVRYATLPNASLDAAAHPFAIKDIVGAHNGMITNWRELARAYQGDEPWIVDSQAAFGAIAAHAQYPEKAIPELEGYWALSWVRRGRLFLTHSDAPGAPLAAAYVRRWQTLFYASELNIPQEVLQEFGVMAPVKTLTADYVYEMIPSAFTTGAIAPNDQAPIRKQRVLKPITGAKPKQNPARYEQRKAADDRRLTTDAVRALLHRIESLRDRAAALEAEVRAYSGTPDASIITDHRQLTLPLSTDEGLPRGLSARRRMR